MIPAETTALTTEEEARFQAWAKENRIADVDDPRSAYDYRGFWKMTQGRPHPPGTEEHFPDTFKQHGHPSFSVESQYSAGPWDGGRWLGEAFVPPGADFLINGRGASRLDPSLLVLALKSLMSIPR